MRPIVYEINRKTISTPFSKMAAVGQGWRPHELGFKLTLTASIHIIKIVSYKKYKVRPKKCNISTDYVLQTTNICVIQIKIDFLI